MFGNYRFWAIFMTETFRVLFLFVTWSNILLTFDFTNSSSGNKTILDHSFRINEHQNWSKFREFPRFEITNCDVAFALCLSPNAMKRGMRILQLMTGGLVCINCGLTSQSRNISVREKPVTQTCSARHDTDREKQMELLKLILAKRIWNWFAPWQHCFCLVSYILRRGHFRNICFWVF